MTLPHIALAVFVNLIWGSMYIGASIGLESFPPIFFAGLRFSLLLFLLGWFIRVPQRLVIPLLKVGLLVGLGMYLTLYLSVSLANNMASIAIFGKLEVPFAVVLGVLLLGERVGIRRISGISLAMIGAAIIGFDPSAFDDLPALFWITVSSAFGAYSMIRIKRLGDVHPLTIIAWVALIGAPTLLLFSYLFEDNHWEMIKTATPLGWSMVFYTAIMSSVVAHSSLLYLLRKYPVGQLAPFSLLSPVFAVIGSVLILDDELTPALILGGGLILFGVGWIIKRTQASD